MVGSSRRVVPTVSAANRSTLLRWAGHGLGAVSLVALVLFVLASSSGAAPTTPSQAFTASSSASGVLVDLTIPGAPLDDNPVNGGGPTAQVMVNTIGTSTGYAAFPDPGPLVVSIPGLIAGLLGLGLAGLPPIPIPSLPAYPFDVNSDANSNPDATLGSGPYRLSAHSTATSSNAAASAGLQTGLSGNASLTTSTASVTTTSSGSVVDTATSDLQALSIGPLVIGEIKSTATETLTSDGSISPSTNISIGGLQIGGIPIALNTQGLVSPGPTEALPINSTLASLLGASGIRVTLVAAQKFANTVESPAVVITVPFNSKGLVGTGSGTLVVTIGAASATMAGSATPAASSGSGTVSGPLVSGSDGSSSGLSSIGGTGTGLNSVGGDVPSGTPSGLTGSAASSPASPGTTGSNSTQVLGATQLVGVFDVKSLYLLLAICGIAAWGLVQMIRRLGVRRPWTSEIG
jgi:hypothetical protein